MREYLIDVPTLTTFRIKAQSEAEAIRALELFDRGLELRIQVGDDETKIKLIDISLKGKPIVVEGDEEYDDEDEETETKDEDANGMAGRTCFRILAR